MNPLIGKTITAVHLANDQQAIKFDIKDGEPIIALCDADCCSYTWIEYIETPENLLGTVVSVENLDMPDQDYDHTKHDVVAFYGCKITTEKGSCLLDYRNDSNGYYGGNLDWDQRNFYGGVFGQNKSSQEWEPVKGETNV